MNKEKELELKNKRKETESKLKQIWLTNPKQCTKHNNKQTCLSCAKKEDQEWMLKNRLRSEVYL